MSSTRLPRFRRVSSIRAIELTDRDREILRQVHRHRFLRSTHLVALLGGSRQHILRRLQLLYHHGFLERPRAQIDYFHSGGSRTIAYGLGNNGAAWLKRELSLPYHRLDWGARNRSTGRLFLEHALLISEIMVTLELACRRNGQVRLLTAEELIPPGVIRRPRNPFQWSVVLGNRTKVGLVPDQAFGLEWIGQDNRPTRSIFFLEADRATMPVTRSCLTRTSFYRKLLAYEATWNRDLHRSRWGFNRFRVLTVTNSPARVINLVSACRQLERGQGLFLFTDSNSLRQASDPLQMHWDAARSDRAESLLDSLLPPRP